MTYGSGLSLQSVSSTSERRAEEEHHTSHGFPGRAQVGLHPSTALCSLLIVLTTGHASGCKRAGDCSLFTGDPAQCDKVDLRASGGGVSHDHSSCPSRLHLVPTGRVEVQWGKRVPEGRLGQEGFLYTSAV